MMHDVNDEAGVRWKSGGHVTPEAVIYFVNGHMISTFAKGLVNDGKGYCC